jgi:GT2 family glycosyltransferase
VNPETAAVGIVIVNYNGRRFLADCLRSLASGTYQNFVVFLVDNNSQDGSGEDAERAFPQVRLLRQSQNLGVAAGNNIGIDACRTHGIEYVLLLNFDILPSPDMLEALVSAAAPSTIVSGYTVAWDNPGLSNSHAGGFDWRLGRLREAFQGPALDVTAPMQEVDIADTCCLFVHRDVFDRIGVMDAAYFMYYDDTDFVVRARRAGIRVLLNPRARLRHFERGAAASNSLSPASVYYSTRNRLYFMRKHSSSHVDYVAFWLYFAFTRAATMARWVLSGRFEMVKWSAKGFGDYITGQMGPGDLSTPARSSAR